MHSSLCFWIVEMVQLVMQLTLHLVQYEYLPTFPRRNLEIRKQRRTKFNSPERPVNLLAYDL